MTKSFAVNRVIGVGVLVTALGVAESAPAAVPRQPATAPQPVKKRVVRFDETTISTDFLTPSPWVVRGHAPGQRSTLIEVRLDFVPELMSSR